MRTLGSSAREFPEQDATSPWWTEHDVTQTAPTPAGVRLRAASLSDLQGAVAAVEVVQTRGVDELFVHASQRLRGRRGGVICLSAWLRWLPVFGRK